VIFNKHNAKFSDVLAKVPETLHANRLFLKDQGEKSAGEWRYLFRSQEDEARLLTVHVFAFNLCNRSGGHAALVRILRVGRAGTNEGAGSPRNAASHAWVM